MTPLARHLHAVQQASGLTLRGLARAIGRHERTVQRWRDGESVPDPTTRAWLLALDTVVVGADAVELRLRRPGA